MRDLAPRDCQFAAGIVAGLTLAGLALLIWIGAAEWIAFRDITLLGVAADFARYP